MGSVKSKIKAARLPEKVIPLCLRGDLLARHEELTAQLVKAQAVGDTSLAGSDDTGLVEQLEAVREEMEADAIALRMRAMSSRRWDALIREHPARAGNEQDQRIGYDAVAFYQAAIKESVVEPKLDAEDWLALLGDDENDGCLTDGQWDELTTAVFDLNKKSISVPFSFAAWLKTKASASE